MTSNISKFNWQTSTLRNRLKRLSQWIVTNSWLHQSWIISAVNGVMPGWSSMWCSFDHSFNRKYHIWAADTILETHLQVISSQIVSTNTWQWSIKYFSDHRCKCSKSIIWNVIYFKIHNCLVTSSPFKISVHNSSNITRQIFKLDNLLLAISKALCESPAGQFGWWYVHLSTNF